MSDRQLSEAEIEECARAGWAEELKGWDPAAIASYVNGTLTDGARKFIVAAVDKAAEIRARTLPASPAVARDLLAMLREMADEDAPAWQPDIKHDSDACAECQEWKARKHPIQHACDVWNREFYAAKSRHEAAMDRWAHRASAAREILDEYRAALPPAPDPLLHAAEPSRAPMMRCPKCGPVVAEWHFFDAGPMAECRKCRVYLTERA